MSTAIRVPTEPVQETKGPQLVEPVEKTAAKPVVDNHPLLPIVAAFIIAGAGAITFIGSVLAYLALRHTDIMKP